jgi:DNA-directed RNA polymerase specialized sigma24 family protein
MRFGVKGVMSPNDRLRQRQHHVAAQIQQDYPLLAPAIHSMALTRLILGHLPQSEMDADDIMQAAFLHMLVDKAARPDDVHLSIRVQAEQAINHVIADWIRYREARLQPDALPAYDTTADPTHTLRQPNNVEELALDQLKADEQARRLLNALQLNQFSLTDLAIGTVKAAVKDSVNRSHPRSTHCLKHRLQAWQSYIRSTLTPELLLEPMMPRAPPRLAFSIPPSPQDPIDAS